MLAHPAEKPGRREAAGTRAKTSLGSRPPACSTPLPSSPGHLGGVTIATPPPHRTPFVGYDGRIWLFISSRALAALLDRRSRGRCWQRTSRFGAWTILPLENGKTCRRFCLESTSVKPIFLISTRC